MRDETRKATYGVDYIDHIELDEWSELIPMPRPLSLLVGGGVSGVSTH